MNRRNNYKDDLKLFKKLSDIGCALGTDFIVGHPGESEELWREGVKRLKELPLTHIHAFSYSKRDNTPSAKVKEQINGKIAKLRHKELTKIVKQKNYEFRLKHNKNLTVLIENSKDGIFRGYDEYYNQVAVESNEDIEHSWILIDSVEVKKEGNCATY